MLLFTDTLHAIPHDPHRELLASLDRILRAVYREITFNGPTAMAQPVTPDLRSRLFNLSTTFNLENAVPSTFTFIHKYAQAFLTDFADTLLVQNIKTPNPSFPATLSELLQRLLLWKQHMIECIEKKEGEKIYHDFFSYNRCIPGHIEIPGQRINKQFHTLNISHVLMLKAHLPAIYKEQHNWRHLDIIDDQHHVHHYYLEQVNSVDLLVEERTLFYQVFFDIVAQDSHAIQMRHINSSIPSYTSLTPTLRLVSCPENSITLEGIFYESMKDCINEKQFEYALKLYFINNRDCEGFEEFAHSISKETIFSDMCDEDLLTRYMYLFRVRVLGHI